MTLHCAKTERPCYERYPACRCVRCRAWGLATAIDEAPTPDARAELIVSWIHRHVRVGGLRHRPTREDKPSA